MSTRLYPTIRKGQPQLRVFLTDFWMKLVKPEFTLLPNQVQFIVSSQMTKYDVKQYLEKVYKVPVARVVTYNKMGKTKTTPKGYVIKEDDYKVALVSLPKEMTFKFPDLFPTTKENEEAKEMQVIKEMEENYKSRTQSDPSRLGIPSWFRI